MFYFMKILSNDNMHYVTRNTTELSDKNGQTRRGKRIERTNAVNYVYMFPQVLPPVVLGEIKFEIW